MKITKIETNFKRNMFLSESRVNSKTYNEKIENQIINIYPDIKYQSIIGFGGAFTASSGYALKLLPKDVQKNVLEDIFSAARIKL